MENVERRLAALERAHRTQRRWLVALVACLLALVTSGAAGFSDVVQARRVE